MRFILRLMINAVAIYAAVALLNGQSLWGYSLLSMETQDWLSFLWLALIFAVVNALIKPILTVIGCPFVILTLGLGTLLINTLLFYLTAEIGHLFDISFYINSFLGAFLGAIIVSIVSLALNSILKDR